MDSVTVGGAVPYEITWEPEGIYWHFSGAVSAAEAKQSNLDVYGNPRFDDIRYQIADFLDVTSFHADDADLHEISTIDGVAAIYSRAVKVALIATDPKVIRLLEAYCQTIAGTPWQARIFHNLEEGRSWAMTRL